jgi:fatty acid desaturase
MTQNSDEMRSPGDREHASAALSARESKALVDDLFGLKPAIFWIDLIFSATIAYGAVAIYLQATAFSLLQIAAFATAGIALFRIATFMHEIVHMRKGHMRAFKLVWNIVAGIPLLTPSLFYTTHADHHSNRHFGTPADGEYLPFGATPPSEIIRFLATIPLIPVLAVLRALILVPVSLVIPTLRRWLLARASAAVISPTYHRRQVPGIWDPLWLAADLGCFAYAASVVWLIMRGAISPTTIGMIYLLVVFAISLNWLRTLAAHRYRNTGKEVSHSEQVLDSINVTGHPFFTELLYPVGLRYHALHHLLPSLPYHALGTAHRRLMAGLPADSPYRQTVCPNTMTALRQLWRDSKACGSDGDAVLQTWREG